MLVVVVISAVIKIFKNDFKIFIVAISNNDANFGHCCLVSNNELLNDNDKIVGHKLYINYYLPLFKINNDQIVGRKP